MKRSLAAVAVLASLALAAPASAAAPELYGHYLGRFTFSGTQLVRASIDPSPVLLLVAGRRLGFAASQEFPACS